MYRVWEAGREGGRQAGREAGRQGGREARREAGRQVVNHLHTFQVAHVMCSFSRVSSSHICSCPTVGTREARITCETLPPQATPPSVCIEVVRDAGVTKSLTPS